MAHYDCSNCGASYGIDWGYCSSCTPKEVLVAKENLAMAQEKANKKWKKKMRDERAAFILSFIKDEQAKHDDLVKRLSPK
jgi:predicted ATP-dependent serine protease